jgi:hypothetical protein
VAVAPRKTRMAQPMVRTARRDVPRRAPRWPR